MGPASARGTYSQSPAITAVARKATRPSRRSFGSRGGLDMVPPLGVSRALYAGPLGPGEPDDRNKWVMPATERPPLLGNLRAMPRVAWVLFAGTFVNRFGSFVITFLVLYLTDRGFSPRTGWPSTRGSRPGRSSPAPAPGGVGDQRARDHPRVDRGHSPASAGVPPAVVDGPWTPARGSPTGRCRPASGSARRPAGSTAGPWPSSRTARWSPRSPRPSTRAPRSPPSASRAASSVRSSPTAGR